MNETIIAWATHTANPVTGCSKPAAVPLEHLPLAVATSGAVQDKWTKPGTSPECQRCYAETLSLRRGWTRLPWTEANAHANVRLRSERFRELARLAVKPVTLPPSQRNRVFIASMGDIFHDEVPDEFLHQLFEHLVAYPNIYMLLTKRPDRAADWPGPWPENIWLGATCGHPVTKWRVEALRHSKAQTRFVSMEPLLASMLPFDLSGIHQLIVGGESGSGYRKMDMRWAREMRDECVRQRCAFFYKQDAAFVTETRPWLVEEDGSCWQYRQFPGELSPPVRVNSEVPAAQSQPEQLRIL